MALEEGITIAKEGISILKSNKDFLKFPLYSMVIHGIFSLAFFIILIIPIIGSSSFSLNSLENLPEYFYYPAIFIYYLITYFISIFFSTALVYYTFQKFYRKEVTVKDGINIAKKNISKIFVWASIAATVGLLLRIVRRRSGKSNIAAAIFSIVGEVAWSFGTLFVVPIMILGDKGPLSAIKDSFSLYIRVFGKHMVASFRAWFWLMPYYLVGFAIFLLAGAVYSLTNNILFTAIPVLAGILWVIYTLMLGLALRQIIIIGLYIYTKTGKLPSGFSQAALKNSIEVKGKYQ